MTRSARANAAAAAAIGLMAIVGGCATVATPGAPRLTGRLSLQVQADGGNAAQGMAASFELRGDGQRGELSLLSPLGTQLARARWAPGEATLETNDGNARFASLDELSQAALGERIPLAALPDWLDGRPWRGAAHEPIEEGFVQLGWRVDLSRHALGRIEARRAAPPPAVVRVILDDERPR